jgi:uncharacterized short protein YbdD (DUF466 family)
MSGQAHHRLLKFAKLSALFNKLSALWRGLRQLSGDDAYERYLQHYQAHHAQDAEPPLSREEFFKQWQDKKWHGVKRCC